MIPNLATVVTEAAPFNDSGKVQEEVFISDGLTTVPTFVPSAVQQQLRSTRVNHHPNDILDDGGNIDPAEAFEVFKGKIFVPSLSDDDDYFRGPRFVSRTVETPVQRLSRLRMEISELESDIQQQQQMLVPINPSEAHNIQDEDDTHQLMLLENMTQMARDLASRLDSIGTISHTLSSSAVSSAGQETAIHASLTNLVQDQIQQIKNLNFQDIQKPALIRKDADSYSSSTISQIILLEQRLTQIEKVLGSNGADLKIPSSSSILQRLEDAEHIVSCLSKEGLDLMASRAKFIRCVVLSGMST